MHDRHPEFKKVETFFLAVVFFEPAIHLFIYFFFEELPGQTSVSTRCTEHVFVNVLEMFIALLNVLLLNYATNNYSHRYYDII